MDVILIHILLGTSSKPAEGVSQGGSGIFRQRGVGTAGVPSRSKGGESCHSDVSRLSRDLHACCIRSPRMESTTLGRGLRKPSEIYLYNDIG